MLFPAVAAFGSQCQLINPSHQSLVHSLGKHTSELKIAFVGDQGLGKKSAQVLKLIKDFGSQMLIQLGDFDYEDNPEQYMKEFEDALGKHFMILATVGNHDVYKWFEPETGYRDLLLRQSEKSGLDRHCSGEYGIQMHCIYNDVLFLVSGVGTLGSNHAEYADSILTQYSYVPWKICFWHKNQSKYQTGDKSDETGYLVYETCRKHGAIIMTSHEHSYERTHLMSNFENAVIASTDNHLQLKPGQSFAVVSGLGGESIRFWHNGSNHNPWWAATAALDNGANYGALLCKFRYKGDPLVAKCEMFDIDGNRWDKFTISTDPTAPQSMESIQASPFYEIPILKQDQITTTTDTGSVVCGSSLLDLSQSLLHTLEFDIPKGNHKQMRLQIMGARPQMGVFKTQGEANRHYSQFKPKITLKKMPVRPLCSEFPNTGFFQPPVTQSIEWEDEFEVGEVWVSPNLIQFYDGSDKLVIGMTSSLVPRSVYGFDQETCLVPTLIVH